MKNAPALLAVVMLEGLGILAKPFGQGPPGRQASDTSPHTEHFVHANGVTLHYLDWGGAGEPLVFLTGCGAPAHVFDDLAPRFTPAFRAGALTRRGRAPSETPSSGYDLETLTADVLALLEALGFDDVVREMSAFYSSLRR